MINTHTFTGLLDQTSFDTAEACKICGIAESLQIYFVDFISLKVRSATSDLNIIDEISLDHKSKQSSNEPDLAALH